MVVKRNQGEMVRRFLASNFTNQNTENRKELEGQFYCCISEHKRQDGVHWLSIVHSKCKEEKKTFGKVDHKVEVKVDILIHSLNFYQDSLKSEKSGLGQSQIARNW